MLHYLKNLANKTETLTWFLCWSSQQVHESVATLQPGLFGLHFVSELMMEQCSVSVRKDTMRLGQYIKAWRQELVCAFVPVRIRFGYKTADRSSVCFL